MQSERNNCEIEIPYISIRGEGESGGLPLVRECKELDAGRLKRDFALMYLLLERSSLCRTSNRRLLQTVEV
jgi:hypothetical protein